MNASNLATLKKEPNASNACLFDNPFSIKFTYGHTRMYSVKVAQRKALLRSFIWFYIASLAEVFVALLLFSLFALSPRQLRWSHRPSARDKSANETREVFRDDSTNGDSARKKSFSVVPVRPSPCPMLELYPRGILESQNLANKNLARFSPFQNKPPPNLVERICDSRILS